MSAPEPLAGAAHLDWLFSLQRFGIKPGLAAMRALLADLGDPQTAFRSVLVAGTNGKGSAARVLAACLTLNGANTGLYTSPHLQRVGERVLVGGAALPDAALAELIGRVRPAAERHGNTFFEALTAAALLAFAEAGVAWAVLEVGLGGRLDATNVVEPRLAIVTSVALDHTGVLGTTLAEIAFEKAGVFRPGVPVLSGVTEAEPASVVRERAAALGAPLAGYGDAFWGEAVEIAWDGTAFVWRHPGARQDGSAVRSPLVGRHQVSNVTLALEGAVALGVPAARAVLAAERTRWPGRLESLMREGRRVVLDGAHNPAAAAALASAVRELEGSVAALVFGASADKDVPAVLEALRGVARTTVLTRAAHSPRAAAPEDLATLVPGALLAREPSVALEAALARSEPGQTVLVAGSLYLVGEVRDLLTGAAPEGRARWQ